MRDNNELKGEEAIKQKNWDNFRNNLTFQDGVNLTREVVFDLIKQNDDDMGNLQETLMGEIVDTLDKITEQYENGRLGQLYNFFHIN